MAWSAQQYAAFEDERTRPVRDLLSAAARMIPSATAHTAIDLGCGPGNSTEVLALHFPSTVVIGLDSSPDMLEAARKRLPGVAFELADIETWVYEPPAVPSTAAVDRDRFDVIVANAVLQWLPDHGRLIPALMDRLTAGGRADLWRTTYHHALQGGAGAIVEWFKGSGLRPYLAPLARAEQAEFLARYGAAVASAYPAMPDGTVLLPFPRLFFIGIR